MLICAYNGSIEFPRFFETYEEAHDAMISDVASVFGILPEEAKDKYENDEDIDEYCGINAYSAFCDRRGYYGWALFDLDGVEMEKKENEAE